MITPFAGEFMLFPLPLECSLNFCSHKCSFCFANLTAPERKADTAAIIRLINQHGERKTLTARLMQEKYPVMLSNRVDPFAASNWRQSLPIMRALTTQEIPISIASRGATDAGGLRAIDEALDFLPRQFWYVSINQNDDDVRKRIEPGSPPLESRYKLIEKLVKRGDVVAIGLNPIVREWMPEPERILQRAKDLGVRGVWVQPMHFNRRMVANMPQRDHDAIGADLVAQGLRFKRGDETFQYAEDVSRMAEAMGFEVHQTGDLRYSKYFDLLREVYPKTFPVIQDFYNLCCEKNIQSDVAISFEQFYTKICEPRLPQGEWYTRDYIGSVARELWKTYNVPTRGTFKDLCSVIWNNKEMPHHPVNYPCFSYAGAGEDDFDSVYVDSENNSFVVFHREGTDKYVTPIQ